MNQVKKLPPVSEISVAVLTLVIAGGVYLASHLPQHVSMTPTVVCIVIAALLVITNVYLINTIPNFAWGTFFLVAKWTLLAYVVIAGTLEYIFIKDGVRGSTLAIMTSTLVLFALNLPIHFGFTVARYADQSKN